MNEILGAAAKERSVESPISTEEGKSSKGACVVQTLLISHTFQREIQVYVSPVISFSQVYILINLLLLQQLPRSKGHKLRSCGNSAKSSGYVLSVSSSPSSYFFEMGNCKSCCKVVKLNHPCQTDHPMITSDDFVIWLFCLGATISFALSHELAEQLPSFNIFDA